jgi:dihydroflavonol-4-reductase
MNTAIPSILLTGATGFLGSHFLPAWAGRNADARAFALVRAGDAGEAKARIAAALARSSASCDRRFDAETLAGRITALPADLARADLGLAGADEALLAEAGIAEVWHFAADPGAGGEGGEMAGVNLHGTERLYALARRIGAKRFVHVSTAYVGAGRSGRVAEAPPEAGGPFGNACEATRAAAELRLLELAREGGPALSILRPTVVLGYSESRASGDTPHGLYGLIRCLASAREDLLQAGGPVRLQVGAGGTIDFVPVDGLMRSMVALADEGFPDGPIHHLAGGIDIDARIVFDMICDRLCVPGVTLVDGPVPDETPLERRLAQELRFFRSYMGARREFASARPGPGAVDEEALLNYIVVGVRDFLFGSTFDVFERRIVPSFDGSELTVHISGSPDLPALVGCNAYGVPPEVWLPLAHDLRGKRRVVVWETRGLPSMTPGLEDDQLSIDCHVGDMLAIMDHLGIGKADLAGWSTGAVVASKAVAFHPERFRSLSLLNGGFVLPGAAEVPFQSAARGIMPKMAVSRQTCEVLYNLIFGNKQGTVPVRREEQEVQKDAGDFVGAIHKGYMHIARLLMRDADSCFRYARIVRSHLSDAENAFGWLPKVTLPTLVLSAEGDIISHPEGSIQAARLIPGSILHVRGGGDHFLFYADEASRRIVCDFLEDPSSVPATAGASGPASS